MKNNTGEFKPTSLGASKLKGARNRFFLAPMLEPNDIAFRLLCKKAGCGLTYTGMINPLSKQKLNLEDNPAIQIFCTHVKGVEEFIKNMKKKLRCSILILVVHLL